MGACTQWMVQLIFRAVSYVRKRFMTLTTGWHRPDYACKLKFLFTDIWSILGAIKLTGENLKVVWAEFSTLSQAVL